jgi:hypothetical protein
LTQRRLLAHHAPVPPRILQIRNSAFCAVLLALCAACKASSPAQSQTPAQRQVVQPQSDANADLAALRLSEACADVAEKYWKRGGYDKPTPSSGGAGEMRYYTSHYNAHATPRWRATDETS